MALLSGPCVECAAWVFCPATAGVRDVSTSSLMVSAVPAFLRGLSIARAIGCAVDFGTVGDAVDPAPLATCDAVAAGVDGVPGVPLAVPCVDDASAATGAGNGGGGNAVCGPP